MDRPQVNTKPRPHARAGRPSLGGRQPARPRAQCGHLPAPTVPQPCPALAPSRRPLRHRVRRSWPTGLLLAALAVGAAGTAGAAGPAPGLPTRGGPVQGRPAAAPAQADLQVQLALVDQAARDEGEPKPPTASAERGPAAGADLPSDGALLGAALLALVWLQRRSRTA